MESTTTQHYFTYPLELVELIFSDLYFPSRRRLFSKIRIDLGPSGKRETQSRNARRLRGILEILSENVALRELIHHLVVEYRFSEYPRDGRGEDSIFKLESSDFRDIFPLVPALRTLTITYPRGESFCTYDEALMSALADLRHSCPYLHRLELIGLRDIPIGFILQWTNVVDLKLHQVDIVIEGGPMLEQSTPVQRLERLSLRFNPWLGFPAPLQTMEVGRLQYLQISMSSITIPTSSQPMLIQIPIQMSIIHAWNLITKCSSTLNHLRLDYVFSKPGSLPQSVSTISFPSLEVLEIDEELHHGQNPFLLPLARFLTPNKTGVFNIQTILISFTAFVPEQIVLHDDEGWSVLDSALTSQQYTIKQYECLSKLEIRLRFTHYKEADKAKEQETSDLLEGCSSRLLPLVSSSQSIDLKFSILVRYSNVTFTWDNHASDVRVSH
ncbi:hypothetical protein BJ912DRAFT_1001037 [Pholiota molesta]|nr:hypothetical protein BJ912DRAFT_1001037 [Pholiota molesta]